MGYVIFYIFEFYFLMYFSSICCVHTYLNQDIQDVLPLLVVATKSSI